MQNPTNLKLCWSGDTQKLRGVAMFSGLWPVRIFEASSGKVVSRTKWPRQRGRSGRVGGGDRSGDAELLLAKCGLDRGGLLVSAAAAMPRQDRHDLGLRQLPAGFRGGCPDEQSRASVLVSSRPV